MLDLFPGVELPYEKELSVAMLEDVGDRAPDERWVERNGNMPSHPNGEIRHKEMRTILADQRNLRLRREIKAPKMRGHALRLI